MSDVSESTALELPSHPAVAQAAEGWVAEEREQIPSWEIGRAFVGCSADKEVVERQRAVLTNMLEHYGTEVEKWDLPPEIREQHNHEATVGIKDFGRHYIVNTLPCVWAAYARIISKDEPTDWYVPEGVRIPNEDL